MSASWYHIPDSEKAKTTLSSDSLGSAGFTVQTPYGHAESSSYLTGTEPVLLVAIQFKLLLYGLRSLKEDILVTADKNLIIFSIDYDLVDQKVFWTDLGAESIKWISMDTKRKGTVVKGMSPHVGSHLTKYT